MDILETTDDSNKNYDSLPSDTLDENVSEEEILSVPDKEQESAPEDGPPRPELNRESGPPPESKTGFDKSEERGIFPLIKRDLPTEEDSDTEPKGTIITSGLSDPGEHFERLFQGLSVAGLATLDFPIDAVTNLIDTEWSHELDNQWDKMTRLPNNGHQELRELLSIVIPSIYTGSQSIALAAKVQGPRLAQALVGAGLFAAGDAAVIGLSDQGEEHNAMHALAKWFPGLFGPEGAVPIDDAIKTLDSDSSKIRKKKNMYEAAGLSIVGSVLGAFIQLRRGMKTMGWFNPLDQKAVAYKANEITKAGDPEKLIRIQEIQEVLSTGSLSKQNEKLLMDEIMQLEDSLQSVDNLDDALRQIEESGINEKNIAADRRRNIEPNNPDFDPDATDILTEADNARQSVPPGNVARNMADTTSIKAGNVDPTISNPAPIITEAMRSKGLMVGSTSRDAIMGVAEEARDIGRFDALTDGFRFTAEQMNAAAWDIYTSIIDPGASMADVRALFETDKDITNLLLGRFKVEHFNEEQARAAAFALRDLADRFLGRSVAESSARAMDTLGREAATIAEAVTELSPVINDNRAMDLIIDKMQFLMDEYGLNKYISGWKLRNKNWFDQAPPGELDTVIEQLTSEFRSAENAIHAKNLKFTKTLKDLLETNPAAIRPLVDAFAHTNGDVDTLAKLMKWASDQVSPMGMIKSPDPSQLNLFARGLWGVRYNNVLSGISTLRAIVGNGAQLITRPITAILGHGILGPLDGFEGLKRAVYYNGAVFETNRRAIKDAWTMMKKAHKDPQLMMQSYRKDFIFKEDKAWDILEDMRAVWDQEGNFGKVIQYDMAKTMKELAGLPLFRYGMTGMVFPDVFTNTHIAHYLSRMRAYDDVFEEFGFADWNRIAIAEKKHYNNMFNANGTINDQALKSLSGEISLNLDDATASWINKGTTAYPIAKDLFMFPRTQSNAVKLALSWQPISLIPGINKYSKTIWARTDDDIAKALAEHGINMSTTPNARTLFENLRAEYVGRLAFTSLITKSLWDYAMAGNIRGNGHYNASRRMKERDQFGYTPKTINLGGKWVSFKGIPMVDQTLSILGDLSYYAGDIDESFLENWQAKLFWTIGAAFLNETPIQGMEPIVAAATGDLSGWNRLIAASTMTMFPLGAGVNVLSNAIDSAQKDIQGEIHEYMMNRIPGLKSMLADQIDIWTGEPLNDIDNPILRALNAISPIKISGTREPWRVWLESTGWSGLSKLRKDSSGSYEYSTDERELIYKYIGEQEIYKQLIPLMNHKELNKDLKNLRAHRASGKDLRDDAISLEVKRLPVIKAINNIVRIAQKKAEVRLLSERPDIRERILRQQIADQEMKSGNVEGAAKQQDIELQKRQLLQMPK